MAQEQGPIVLEPGQGRAVPGPYGRSIVIKAAGEATGGTFSVLEFTASAGGSWTGAHAHPDAQEAWYVLEGELTFRIEDETFPAPAGTFILLPRGTKHTFGNTGSTTARYLVIYSPAGMEQYFPALSELVRASPSGQVDEEAVAELARRHGMEFR